ncbi:hypothetical protein [Chryseobacterium joostei]|uniref:hypothetical protein n=1 Tax=Chryseobacterium joostei TaxID=112234 RepID=UPI003D0E0ED3
MEIVNFKIKNFSDCILGIKLYDNENLLVTILNPVDYVLDGIRFTNFKKIENITNESDSFKNKVMKLKFQRYLDSLNLNMFKDFKISNFQNLFTIIKQESLLCEFSFNKEDVVYIGNIINVYDSSIDVNFYDDECQLDESDNIDFENITSVTIFSDYLNSLSEFMKSNLLFV